MIIGIGNVGSASLKSRIVEIDDSNRIRVPGEAKRTKETIEIQGLHAGVARILD